MPTNLDPDKAISRGRPTRIVLFGMDCPFTMPILRALVRSTDAELSALVMPKPAQSPFQSSASVPVTAAVSGITLIQFNHQSAVDESGLRTTLDRIAPDLIVVACFPWRFPKWLLSLPRLGCLNIHPSLLPDARGPEPVFWAFRWGLSRTGVTLHLMDSGWDTGPLIAQLDMPIPEDATIVTLEQSLARMGANLLVEHLQAGLDGPIVAFPQPADEARYAPLPSADDLRVSTAWKARDAARFIHAVSPRYGAIEVLVLSTGQRLAVDGVVSIHQETPVQALQVDEANLLSIAFAEGTLVCRPATVTQPLSLRVP